MNITLLYGTITLYHKSDKKGGTVLSVFDKLIHQKDTYDREAPEMLGSFDAAKEKRCPYCGSEYAIDSYDWVVVRFESE